MWNKAQDTNDKRLLTTGSFQTIQHNLSCIASAYNSNSKQLLNKMYDPDFSYENQEVPIFVIYTHPDPSKIRGLSIHHFVDQYCHSDYPAYLASFDVHNYVKDIPTKKDPNWSKENGTQRMLSHDFAHISAQNIMQDSYPDWRIEIQQIYNIMRANYKPYSNEYKVLHQGLFALIHEVTISS